MTVLVFCRYLKHTHTAGTFSLFITKLAFVQSIHWILDSGSQNHLYVQAQVHFIKAPPQKGLTNTFSNDILEVSAWPPRAQLAPKNVEAFVFPSSLQIKRMKKSKQLEVLESSSLGSWCGTEAWGKPLLWFDVQNQCKPLGFSGPQFP